MFTVAILINGQPVMARSAVNTGKTFLPNMVTSNPGKTRIYRTDSGDLIGHNPEDGAVVLAIKLLKTIG